MCGPLHTEIGFCHSKKYLDDGTDCYFTCWNCFPGIVLGVMIHHPPLHLLFKDVCGHLHPHKGVSTLPKISKELFLQQDSCSLLRTLLQLLYHAILQDGYGTPVKTHNLIILCNDPFRYAMHVSCMLINNNNYMLGNNFCKSSFQVEMDLKKCRKKE